MRKIALFILAIILISSCGSGSSPAVEEKSDEMDLTSYDIDMLSSPQSLIDRFSYAYGNLLAESLESAEQEVNPIYFARGFLDYYGSSFFSDEELDQIFIEYQNNMLEEAEREFAREAAANLSAAEEFLAVNGKRSGVVTTSSGLEYEVIRSSPVQGARSPEGNDIVLIDYTMTLLNGQIVESSYDRGDSSEISMSNLIAGVREALSLMSAGDRYRFWIHPDLAYGEDGNSVIGPNELLIFEVELKGII